MQRLARYQPGSTGLLVRNPMVWAAGIALGAGTAVLAGIVAALAVIGGAVGTTYVALRTPKGRHWSDRVARRTAQRVCREDREARLEAAGVHDHALATATLLVDEITTADPALAAYLELEALLDRYAELEITTKRYERVLARPSAVSPVPERSASRAVIRNRSEALRRTCEARLADGRDEMAGIVELLQFLLQRSVLEVTEPQADPVGNCLALLED
jgi:hypothetical protein